MTTMDEDERAEYEATMREAGGDPSNGGKNAAEAAARLHQLLLDAEQAQRRWASRVLDDDVLEGHVKRLKEWWKKQAVVLVSYKGSIIGKTTRVGARKRDEDGREMWQQTLFHSMTWNQVIDWLEMVERQLGGLLVNKAMGRRLLQLRDACPDSIGPADAAERLGVSVEDWLAEVA